MPRAFDVPSRYKSPEILAVKGARQSSDPRKKDRSPSLLDFGSVRFHLARHFGFCFGVENAIEIAYRVLRENPDRRIFLLSEMIHNPHVNADLLRRGVRFLMGTDGRRLIDFSELSSEDIVIVPAFGTTIELQKELESHGVDPYSNDATCPFVEKVWKRAADLGSKGFSIVVHGKRNHEETRATFSHSAALAPTLVVKDMREAQKACQYIRGEISIGEFMAFFYGNTTEGYEPETALSRLGVVNQTTMLASETHEIALAFKTALLERYGEENLQEHFADTRDTLCYATYENQSATEILTQQDLDFMIVVGGYNSSNTSHLAELGELRLPTYYIQDASDIISAERISHWSLKDSEVVSTEGWLSKLNTSPSSGYVSGEKQSAETFQVGITAGASCPDVAVEAIIRRIVDLVGSSVSFEQVISGFNS